MPEGVFVTDLWHRFRLGGTQRELTGDIQQTEQLEGWTTYAATVELYDEPTLVRGAEVDIYQVDFQLSTTVPQFSGFVNKVRASSRPNTVKLDLLGPLYRLRRATLSGMNLTGMTEGEAWKAIMDACNVPYADADVADSGYVLGAQVPIFWRREQQGWEIIRELDQVFGMATIEVHAGRVVRFPYDRVPDQSMISRTYTAFADADLFSLDREYWGLDEIVNSWEVRGATWQDANNCSYTPWAKADGPNDAFETSGTRVSRKPFSSDIIQDEALAEAVVRRLMRWWNRDPDFIGVITDNDLNVLPGSIIGAKDDKNYGIGLTTAATTNPYLVLTVDRRGNMMELHCVGGDAGDEGTVTHGIEKRCNQTLSTGDLPGLYSLPLIGVPPFYIPDPYVCLDFGGPGGVCPDEAPPGDPFCLTSSAPATWFNEDGQNWTISGSDITSPLGGNEVADTNEKIPRIAGKPVSYTVTFNATVNGAGGFELYATDNDASFPVHWYFTYMTLGSPGADTQLYDYDAWTGGGNLPLEWGDATDGATVVISISWDRIAETITASVGGVTHTLTGAVDGTTGGGLFFVAISHSFGTLGEDATSHISNFTISIDEDAALASCDGMVGIVDGDWVEVDPTLDDSGGSIITSQQGSGYNQAIDIDPANYWRLKASIIMLSGTGSHDFHFGVSRASSPTTGQFEILVGNSAGDVMYLQTTSDYAYLAGTPFNDDETIDVTLEWEPSTNTLSATLVQGARTETLDLVGPVTPSGTGVFHPFILSSGPSGGGGGVEIDSFGVTGG